MRTIPSLFDSERLRMEEAIAITAESLTSHAARHPHWCFAWSGGKDSTATLTLCLHLIETGQVPRPERLTVLYADTRMELAPLWLSAQAMLEQLRMRGIEARTVLPPLDKRFLVYILGRGVPPPNNNTLRWCTRQIKLDPMRAALLEMAQEDRILTITGVRQGESAVRDGRIAMSCGINGSECGQGWYQQALPGERVATLAPLLHWRVCHIWDWLLFHAPAPEYGNWPTSLLARVYGGDEAEEINARTGCVCCPLASRDTALDALLRLPEWSHLAPLKELRDLYLELRKPRCRLRKPGGERRKDGNLSPNQHRMGPLTFEARRGALAWVLDIQGKVNAGARAAGRPEVDILNAEEQARIEQLIDLGTWPNRWDGDEPLATEPFEESGLLQLALAVDEAKREVGCAD